MSISSAVMSFFSYFQNLGCQLSLPQVQMPDKFVEIIETVKNFLRTLQLLIPQIPQFDVRTQMIIMAVVIPLVLDMFFVWFVQPISTTLLHVFDLACIVTFFIFLALSFLGEFETYKTIILLVLGVIILIRFIYLICKKRGTSFGLLIAARNICNHFLYGILPKIEKDLSQSELEKIIQQCSQVVQIQPTKPNPCGTLMFFLVGALFIAIALSCFKVIPIPLVIPQFVLMFLPYICIILGTIFLLVFFLRLCHCGRNFIMKFKQFCKRWGLRLLMLFLDLLYIPIISLLVSHIMIEKVQLCPVGEYPYYHPDRFHNIISLLVTHNITCMPCNVTTFECSALCNGPSEFRLIDDHSVNFVNDVLKVSGGFILYVAVFVMIGIPLLWYVIITRNRQFAYNVNVYGSHPEEKWTKLVNRMKTTGIFLFVNYKYNFARWSVFYLVVKFLVMLITAVASKFFTIITFLLPILYFFVFGRVIFKRPYIYSFNNVLDSILYFTQSIFALFSFIQYFDFQIPPLITQVLSIITLVVPFISILCLFFCKTKAAQFDDDPTYPQKLTPEMEEELERKREKARKKKRKHRRHHHREEAQRLADSRASTTDSFAVSSDNLLQTGPATDDPNQPLLENGDENVGEQQIVLDDLDDNEFIALIIEDECLLGPNDMDTVEQCIQKRRFKRKSKKKNGDVEPEDQEEEETRIINKRTLAKRCEKMYEMLDIVVDGSTIDFLTSILNIAIMFAMAALGWYVGAILCNDRGIDKPVCGPILD